MQFTAFTRTAYSDAPFAVHRSDCADITKEKQNHGSSALGTFATLVEAIAPGCIDDEMRDMGYSEDDVKVFSCCRGQKGGV